MSKGPLMDVLVNRLKKHSVEVGDCWEWFGSYQSSGKTPAMNFEGHIKPVRRHIAEQLGIARADMVATCKCRNYKCVNPDHVVLMTRTRLAKLIEEETGYARNPARVKKISDKARARSPVTQEMVEQIRQEDVGLQEMAQRFGIGKTTVAAIRRGEAWRDFKNPFAQLMGL